MLQCIVVRQPAGVVTQVIKQLGPKQIGKADFYEANHKYFKKKADEAIKAFTITHPEMKCSFSTQIFDTVKKTCVIVQ
jgi:hypothetical protein